MSVDVFESNMRSLFGARGERWLQDLPHLIDALAKQWHLQDVQPIDHMTYNFVAYAMRDGVEPVVLKVSCDPESLQNELCAMRHFSGCGMVEVLAHDQGHQAMLMRRFQPGYALFHDDSCNAEQVIQAYASVVKKLIAADQGDQDRFRSIEHWLRAFDRADPKGLPRGLLDQGKRLRDRLLTEQMPVYVLHGDLHDGNILADGAGWGVIDPKGIVGELAFEVAKFDFVHPTEHAVDNVSALLDQRILQMAALLSLEAERLKDWVFLRLLLGACWKLEDHGHTGRYLNLLTLLFPQRLEMH